MKDFPLNFPDNFRYRKTSNGWRVYRGNTLFLSSWFASKQNAKRAAQQEQATRDLAFIKKLREQFRKRGKFW